MKTEKELLMRSAYAARFPMIDDDAAKGTKEIEQPRREAAQSLLAVFRAW